MCGVLDCWHRFEKGDELICVVCWIVGTILKRRTS